MPLCEYRDRFLTEKRINQGADFWLGHGEKLKQISDPQLADPTIDRWFDVGAFAAPPIGRFGTAARGAIESPGLNLWHFGLAKRFRVSDRPGTPIFRIEATATNIVNHPQWAAPNTNVTPTNVSAGRISAIGGTAGAIQQAGMRAIRLGGRIEW